jgi:hypothetical protein
MHKSATKCNETLSKWCKNKHGASKIIDTFETYQVSVPKSQHVFKISKTFSSTKSDLQVKSSSGTYKVPSVVSGALEETIDLRDFYFRAPGSLVVLSFPQPLNFSSV